MRLKISKLPFDIRIKQIREKLSKYGDMVINPPVYEGGINTVVIEISDEQTALQAKKELDNAKIFDKKQKITVEVIKEIRRDNPPEEVEQPKAEVFPYRFCKRKPLNNKPLKNKPIAFHDKLNDGHYDIAFDITWKTLTPTAVNPCNDKNVPKNNPPGSESEYAGYDKRWLMTEDNRLVISPFTVKSAIANGFANIMGGCYRVMNINKIEGHPKDGIKDGQYPYNGAYKRYRVKMDNQSQPGVIEKMELRSDGSCYIEIQPVIEYYYDDEKPITFIKGEAYFAKTVDRKYKKFIDTQSPVRLADAGVRMLNGETKIIYYGKYTFGMNLTLGPGDLGKNHYHRFYTKKSGKDTGVISAINFESPDEMKKKVYMGKFDHVKKPDPRPKGGFWYQDLSTLNKGDWIYYQKFNGEITNIGKNYQFKALFLHEDTVPDKDKACKNINCLCPRCALFGMTGEETNNEAVGFKGRFKSSALLNNLSLIETPKDKRQKMQIPCLKDSRVFSEAVEAAEWKSSDGETVSRQFFLPIQASPKPNKRDVEGYFDKDGKIRGAKYYLHGSNFMDLNEMKKYIITQYDSKKDINKETGKFVYSHQLRNYAQVCEPEIEFTGTVGAENCTSDEIAALMLLLDSKKSGHGFKIGLGKAFGMGSIESSIGTIWIRKKEAYLEKEGYQWHKFESFEQLPDELIKQINQAIDIRKVIDRFNSLNNRKERKLQYPDPVANKNLEGKKYWEIFLDSSNKA